MYGLYDTVDKDYILSRVTPEEVFTFYGFAPKEGKKYRSPFRKDSVPSLSFHLHSDGELCIKDFGNGYYGDFVSFVSKLYNITYGKAVQKIAHDMNLAQLPASEATKVTGKEAFRRPSSGAVFGVVPRAFSESEYSYWRQFGIGVAQLKKFRIFVIDKLWINNRCYYTYKQNDPAFAYKFENSEYKIYFPLRDDNRFLGNFKGLQGHSLLPEQGDFLCITKSYKDVMLFDRLGVPSVAPSAEMNYIPDEIIEDYKKRFGFVCSLYDFDYAGIVGANRLKKRHHIPAYFFTTGRFGTIPFKQKDLSDFYKHNGPERTEFIINTFKQSV